MRFSCLVFISICLTAASCTQMSETMETAASLSFEPPQSDFQTSGPADSRPAPLLWASVQEKAYVACEDMRQVAEGKVIDGVKVLCLGTDNLGTPEAPVDLAALSRDTKVFVLPAPRTPAERLRMVQSVETPAGALTLVRFDPLSRSCLEQTVASIRVGSAAAGQAVVCKAD